ncbi:hypothetical protein [Bilophila wadsworthia]|uniref:hypothetical protein n=1 Tax=Bilophila wadsworthia TaxID=35833 RepID=UPI0027B99CFD|nr:hypothetical protein [Bilophila wadsworthia]
MAVKQLPKISDLPEPPDRLVGDQERFDVLTFNSLKAQKKMVNEDLNKALIPALNQFAVDVNVSVDAAKASETSALASKNAAASSAATATTKAGEAAASAKAAKTSETSALASKNAASSSATAAANAQKAAEAARDEAQDLANVGFASEIHAGLAKVDGKTTQADAGGVITVKDVAIGGDSSDLASTRGQVGDLKIATATNYPSILTICKSCRLYFNGTEWGKVADRPFEAGYGAVVIADVSSDALRGEIWAFSLSGNDAWKAQFNEKGTSPFARFVMSNAIGDGIRVTNGIISVPEYEGATASAAGTSGLVPPATSGQQDSFLTGGGEYKPALSTGGGTVTGNLSIKNMLDLINAAPATEQELGLFMLDKNGTIMGAHDFVHNVKNIKSAQMYARNSSGLISSLGVYVEEDGTRYTLSSHNLILTSDVEIGRMYADGVRLITFSGTKGSPGLMMRYSPDSGELYLDGRAMHGKADTAGYADAAGSANALGGKAESALSVAYARDSGAMNGKAESALSVSYAANANYANSAGSAPANGGTAWATTVTPNVAFVGRDGAMPNGGTWLYIYMPYDSHCLRGVTLAGGATAPSNDGGIAIRVA